MTGAELAIQLLITSITHANELGALVNNARAQGRDVTDAELDAARAKYADSRAALLVEIDKARKP